MSDTISCGVYLFSTAIFDVISDAIKEKQALADELGIDNLSQYRSSSRLANTNAAMSRNDRVSVYFEFDILKCLVNKKLLFAFICDKNQFWVQVKTGSSTIQANRKYLQVF